MQGLYLEEFEVGRKFEHGLRRTVTEMDNTLFSCLTHNPQPLHIDHEFAAKSEWGKPLMNSLFTLGLMVGIAVNDTTFGTTIALIDPLHIGTRGSAPNACIWSRFSSARSLCVVSTITRPI